MQFVRLCRRATRSLDQVVHFQGWMAEWSKAQFKALVSSEAWIRIPLQSYIPVSLVCQESRLSPARPVFNSRTGNFFCRTAQIGPNSPMGTALEFQLCVPPELHWQSGWLLNARSSVRSRVEAHLLLSIFFCSSRGGVSTSHTGRMQGAHQG